MRYFLDKLKEFLVFLVFSRLVQGVVLLLQELVEDVAVATSSRHADLSLGPCKL